MCLLASVLTLAAVAVERFIAVIFPLKTMHLRPGQIYVAVTAIWVTSATVGLPLYVFREEQRRQWKDHLEIWCSEDSRILQVALHVHPGTLLHTVHNDARL